MSAPPTQQVVVPTALAGERLDRALALLTGLTRAEVSDLIAAGKVSVADRVEVRRARRLEEGDRIVLRLPAPRRARPEASPAPAGTVPFEVLYEDPDLIVVNKPVGIVTHPGAGREAGTLVNGLVAAYPELAELPRCGLGSPDRPGIVHRLDKETSGVLVVARSVDAFKSLSAQLATRALSRRYRALASGSLSSDRGLIDAPLARSGRDPTSMAVVAAGGREARTRYEVLRRYTEPVLASELAVDLDTGRTHQIRVHLSAIGHPVLGDRRYGGVLSSSGVTRLMLHAESIRFVHPTSGRDVEIRAELPESFRRTLASFS